MVCTFEMKLKILDPSNKRSVPKACTQRMIYMVRAPQEDFAIYIQGQSATMETPPHSWRLFYAHPFLGIIEDSWVPCYNTASGLSPSVYLDSVPYKTFSIMDLLRDAQLC